MAPPADGRPPTPSWLETRVLITGPPPREGGGQVTSQGRKLGGPDAASGPPEPLRTPVQWRHRPPAWGPEQASEGQPEPGPPTRRLSRPGSGNAPTLGSEPDRRDGGPPSAGSRLAAVVRLPPLRGRLWPFCSGAGSRSPPGPARASPCALGLGGRDVNQRVAEAPAPASTRGEQTLDLLGPQVPDPDAWPQPPEPRTLRTLGPGPPEPPGLLVDPPGKFAEPSGPLDPQAF